MPGGTGYSWEGSCTAREGGSPVLKGLGTAGTGRALQGQAGHCKKDVDGTRHCWEGPDTAGRDGTLLGGTGQFWEGLGTAGRDQALLGGTGHYWEGPDSAGKDRALLGGTRYCREGLGRSKNQPSAAGASPGQQGG